LVETQWRPTASPPPSEAAAAAFGRIDRRLFYYGPADFRAAPDGRNHTTLTAQVPKEGFGRVAARPRIRLAADSRNSPESGSGGLLFAGRDEQMSWPIATRRSFSQLASPALRKLRDHAERGAAKPAGSCRHQSTIGGP